MGYLIWMFNEARTILANHIFVLVQKFQLMDAIPFLELSDCRYCPDFVSLIELNLLKVCISVIFILVILEQGGRLAVR